MSTCIVASSFSRRTLKTVVFLPPRYPPNSCTLVSADTLVRVLRLLNMSATVLPSRVLCTGYKASPAAFMESDCSLTCDLREWADWMRDWICGTWRSARERRCGGERVFARGTAVEKRAAIIRGERKGILGRMG
jgi:hypothetical protein